ncbi:MAG: endolytic transglycosylase MltG [Agarilytica sp.]
MTISPLKILFAIIVWSILTLSALGVYVWQWLVTERSVFDENVTYVVESGASLYAVANDLKEKGALQWPKVWVNYARIADLSAIKAGEYAFSQTESPLSILSKLNKGKVVQYQITFVEGSNFTLLLDALHKNTKITRTVTRENVLETLQRENVNIDHVEGWFYPDTYHFSLGDTDVSILLRAYEKMKVTLAKEWLDKGENLPYKNAYEALIMASIIEKETGAAHERSQISGVFVRRLKKGMRLQTDPTVIYGMGDSYEGNIRRKDLRTPTPYNTYTIKGLPPTPIAMPGQAAIHAALHPKPGESLYFVAKGDGTHQFSNSIEAHNKAVREYQKKRRSDYRSSPANTPEPAAEVKNNEG